LAKKKISTSGKDEGLAGHQFGFSFGKTGYTSLVKLTIVQAIKLQFHEDKQILFDWLQAIPIDFVRIFISGIETIAAYITSFEDNRVKVLPGAFKDDDGTGHLSAEVCIACNSPNGPAIVLEKLQLACIRLMFATFGEIEQIGGPRLSEPVEILDAQVNSIVEEQVSALINGKIKASETPFLITVGECTFRCAGRKKQSLSTGSPVTRCGVLSGFLIQVVTGKDRTITIKSKERGTFTVNCSTQQQIREIREFVGEATTVEIDADVTYQDDVATAYSYRSFLRAYSDNLFPAV
jgi:hypothetical protein